MNRRVRPRLDGNTCEYLPIMDSNLVVEAVKRSAPHWEEHLVRMSLMV